MVAIGHDYVASAADAAGKPLANAAFLPSRNPIRIVVLTAWADASAIAHVETILGNAAKSSGRAFVRTTVASAPEFVDKLSIDGFDVALVLDQSAAPDGKLATAGGAGKATFSSYTKAGGVIVVLDGGSGQMSAFLEAGALIGTTGHAGLGGKSLDVVDPADAVGIDVLSPYLSPSGTSGQKLVTTSDPLQRIVVAEPTSGLPVVIHRVVKP